MANPAKSLPELIASGGFRPDRHWHLVVGAERPAKVPEHTWNEIVSKAKSFARRKIDAEKRTALALAEFADELTPKEVAAYEALLAALPRPEFATEDYDALFADLRDRSDREKRMSIRIGLPPPDRLKADELAGVEPVVFASWAELHAKHPKGEGAPLRFRISA